MMIKSITEYLYIKTQVNRQNGMTLLDLVISMALIGIVALAAFKGMEFAYYAATSSDELVENVYQLQGDMESDLTLTGTLTGSESADDFVLGESDADEIIYFDWESGSGLTDFQTTGILVERDAEGGTHMDIPIYIFIPVSNTSQ